MWIVAKALHTSPFDKHISTLSTPQLTWILGNHYRDQEEEFDKIKMLCRFINPEAARLVFDQDKERQTSLSTDDAFFKELQEHTKEPITPDMIDQAFEAADSGQAVAGLDRIEVVDNSKE